MTRQKIKVTDKKGRRRVAVLDLESNTARVAGGKWKPLSIFKKQGRVQRLDSVFKNGKRIL